MKYKAGDKVRIKSLDWYNENKDEFGNIDINYDFTFYADRSKYCGKVFTISEVFDNCYSVKEDNDEYYWIDEMIEGLAEEENTLSKNAKLVSERFAEYVNPSEFKHSQDTIMKMLLQGAINLPQGYQFKDENGNVINATKIVLEKKKKEYPKTFEECRDYIESCHVEPFCADLIATGYKSKLIESFARLYICRDAYWQIAGDEMGLGKPWEPDWNIRGYYAIARSYGNVIKTSNYTCDLTFVFPTEEMRDAFYENFKSEIESCKELL